MSSVASTIIAQVITTLKTIDGTGSFQTNVQSRVYRYWVDPQTASPDEFPYICFGPIDYSEEHASANYQVKQIDTTVTLALFNVYTDATADTAIMDLYSDTKRALEADVTLSGNVRNLQVGGLSVAQVIGEKSGFVSGYVRLTFTFRHAAGDPATAR